MRLRALGLCTETCALARTRFSSVAHTAYVMSSLFCHSRCTNVPIRVFVGADSANLAVGSVLSIPEFFVSSAERSIIILTPIS